MPKMAKVRALEEATGITRKTAIKWINNGTVKGCKIGGLWYVDADDLARVLGETT